AEAVVHRFQVLERFGVGLLLRRVAAARRERHRYVEAGGLDGLLEPDVAAEHDYVGDAGAGLPGDPFVHREHPGQTLGLVAGPVLLRREADARAVGAAAHVRTAVGAGAVPGGADHLAPAQAGRGDPGLDGVDVVVRPAGRHRILPDQVFLRHPRADVARLRAHVAVGQLEPGAGEAFLEVGLIVAETLGDLAVLGVELQRHVGVGHDRHAA